MTEEEMLDYFQKNAIPHDQVGGKLRVTDNSQLPAGFQQYFGEGGFFIDAEKKGVEREVKESIAEEGLGTEPAEKPGPEPEAEEKTRTTRKTPAKATSKKK